MLNRDSLSLRAITYSLPYTSTTLPRKKKGILQLGWFGHQFQTRASSFRNPNCNSRFPSFSLYSSWLIDSWGSSRTGLWFRVNQRRTLAKASNWDEQRSPYETLGKILKLFTLKFVPFPENNENGRKGKKFQPKRSLAAEKTTDYNLGSAKLLLNSMHLGLSPSFVNGWLCSGVNDVSLCCRKRIGMEKFPWILVLTVDSSIDYAETTELDRDADEEQIKSAYRRLAKFYHPDVYDGRGSLEEGETAEARFIKIQAAYELLIDDEKRRQYDMDNRVNPMKASEAWMEWLMKKRKAFAQRGDMAVAAWAEQQQRQLNLRVRQLSRSKMDPDEARKILAREKAAAAKNFSNTLKRHTLVLKKRDLMRRKAEQDQDKLISQLLAAEGLESDTDE
ncbi:hypothetical protein AHAS_Ahas17G0285300 [Arachis hypogaea]